MHNALSSEDRRDVISQSDEFLLSAKRMPIVETYFTVWNKTRDNESVDGESTKPYDHAHPNHCILIILAYVLDYWRRYVVAVSRYHGETYVITTYIDLFKNNFSSDKDRVPETNNSNASTGNVDDYSSNTPATNGKTSEVIDLTEESWTESNSSRNELESTTPPDPSPSNASKIPISQSVTQSGAIDATVVDPSFEPNTFNEQVEIPTAIPIPHNLNNSSVRTSPFNTDAYNHFYSTPWSFNENPSPYLMRQNITSATTAPYGKVS